MAAAKFFARLSDIGVSCFGVQTTNVGLRYNFLRRMSNMTSKRTGLVLGIYQGEKDDEFTLSKATQHFQSKVDAKLTELIQVSGLAAKKGKHRVFFGLSTDYPSVALVSLGKKDAGFNEAEEIDEARDNVRIAVAAGVKQMKEDGVTTVYVDPSGDPEAAAEAAHLCVYEYDELKTDEKKKIRMDLKCFTEASDDASSVEAAWKRGTITAEAQNLAKYLMEAPANKMTPSRFAEVALDKLGTLPNVHVQIWDKTWAESKGMGAFLSVSQGSDEPLRFVEVEYKGGKEGDAPLAIVGKGITFDSGGISIKPSAGMEDMRADMGGAACTLASIYAAARLQLPINVRGLMPLCENVINGRATKPGDVHTAMNGKTIQIDNTDAEGRLVLADGLCYAETYKPRAIIDVATLTGAVIVALGSAATGVFTNSTEMWETMHQAGTRTGDRVWRLPLFQHFAKQMTECRLADLNNIGTGGRYGGSCTAAAFLKAGMTTGDRVWRLPLFEHYVEIMKTCRLADLVNTVPVPGKPGGSCCAAAFLKEFVTNDHWMHMDIAGVTGLMGCKSSIPYMGNAVTGRPTRTMVEFMHSMSKK